MKIIIVYKMKQEQIIKDKGSRSGYNNNNVLEKFKEKLKSKGIRGLLYLHRQFILSCSNTNKITLNDLKNIFRS